MKFNLFKPRKRKRTYNDINLGGTYLSMLTPDPKIYKGYRLHEDYVEVVGRNPDNTCVIAPVFVFIKSNKADLNNQWGVSFIRDLVNDTVKNSGDSHNLNVVFIENIKNLPKDWIKKNQTDTDRYTSKIGNDHRQQAAASTQQEDLMQIATELNAGGSYLAVGFKYVVTASSVDKLDDFLDSLQRRLELRIPGTIITLANGNIDHEMSTLFNDPMKEPGKKLMFTSQEFAGSYNLVTNGIEDMHGFYAGEQVGDISNAAVIWDMSAFSRYAVIAVNNKFARKRDFYRGSIPEDYRNWTGIDLWVNTLIMQLVKEQPVSGPQHHVFTLALDPIQLDDHLTTTTSVIDLSKGHLNPFEMFGDTKDELSIFPANLEKWNQMTRQLAVQTYHVEGETSRSIVDMNELTDLNSTLENFYIDNHMWVKNPKENRDKIRIVGIPSSEVPTLSTFIAYLVSEYATASDPETGDPRKAAEYNTLLSLYRQLDLSNGDLFNTRTDPMFSSLGIMPHTLFNYSGLSQRKGNILLVQLLNSFSAIANQTHTGDTIIIHGAQRITSLTQQYITSIIEDLERKGVRVVYSYTSPTDMLKQVEFNHMPDADWTLTGHLTPDQCAAYNKALGNQRQMTEMIAKNIQSSNEACYYLRRNNDNVIFEANQSL